MRKSRPSLVGPAYRQVGVFLLIKKSLETHLSLVPLLLGEAEFASSRVISLVTYIEGKPNTI